MNPTLLLLAEWEQYVAFLNHPETLVFLIPILAIVVGGVMGIVKLLIRHRERMAMIERGMHPDCPREENDPQHPS